MTREFSYIYIFEKYQGSTRTLVPYYDVFRLVFDSLDHSIGSRITINLYYAKKEVIGCNLYSGVRKII